MASLRARPPPLPLPADPRAAGAAPSHPARVAAGGSGSGAGRWPPGPGMAPDYGKGQTLTAPHLMAPSTGKEEACFPQPLAAAPRFRRR